MKRMIPTLAFATALLAGPALAQTAAPEIPDVDGNGLWSMEELQAAYPSLTDESFGQIDTSGDGQVDMAEYEAAVTAGLLGQ
ncbi:EF-hand domain-containing protein [Szabonella alba]|nr:EF-hand domain-containing protein [Szabonella alba]